MANIHGALQCVALWGSVVVYVLQVVLSIGLLSQGLSLSSHGWPDPILDAEARVVTTPKFAAPVVALNPRECVSGVGADGVPIVTAGNCPVIVDNCNSIVEAAGCEGSFAVACQRNAGLDCTSRWLVLCGGSFPDDLISDTKIDRLCADRCSSETGSRPCSSMHSEPATMLDSYLSLQTFSWIFMSWTGNGEDIVGGRRLEMIVLTVMLVLSLTAVFVVRLIVHRFVRIKTQPQGGFETEHGFIPRLEEDHDFILRRWTRLSGTLHHLQHILLHCYLLLTLCGMYFVRWEGNYTLVWVPPTGVLFCTMFFFSVILAVVNNLKGLCFGFAAFFFYVPILIGGAQQYIFLVAEVQPSPWLGESFETAGGHFAVAAHLIVFSSILDVIFACIQAYIARVRKAEATGAPIGELIHSTSEATVGYVASKPQPVGTGAGEYEALNVEETGSARKISAQEDNPSQDTENEQFTNLLPRGGEARRPPQSEVATTVGDVFFVTTRPEDEDFGKRNDDLNGRICSGGCGVQ
mmetsp:Transcript_21536/g.55088  ORF Transcript_21536/g.55088 Transcript_21536/m.55088 type:complete len:521 (-) Transcript_21536:79-1641(-)